jgi:DNA-binding phage protein
MTRLTPHARQALETLVEEHSAYVLAKATLEAELKKQLNEQLAVIKRKRDIALRLAAEAGVPRTQLGKTIGTSNYKTVQDILAETSELVTRSTSAGWTIAKQDDGTYRVVLQNFGFARVSGEAVVSIDEAGEFEHVSGDAFVVGQLYQNDAVTDVLASI